MISRPWIIAAGVLLLGVLGVGGYVLHLRRRAATLPPTIDARPLAPPATGPQETVILYLADDTTGALRQHSASIPLSASRQQKAQATMAALVNQYLAQDSPHRLPPGSEARAVFLVEPGIAVIDINAALADGHRSGVLVEELTVASLLATLGANVGGIERTRIVVDGKTRLSLAGHADLSRFFTASEVQQMLAELQP